MNFILGQLMSGVALIITVISFQQNNKNTILFLLGFSNIFYALSYFFLGAYSGMVLEGVATVRMFSFYFLNKSVKAHPIRDNFVLLIFELALIGGAVSTWNSAMWLPCLVQILGYTIYTYGCWQKNIFIYYATYIFVMLCVIFYNIYFEGWLNIIIHAFLIVVVLRAYLSKKYPTKRILIKTFRAYKLDRERNKKMPVREFD